MEIRTAALLVAAFLTAGCGASPTGPSGAPAVRQVVVLGDSLAVAPSLRDSFPAQLETMIAASALPWTVINAGISGDTTADGVRRMTPLLGGDVGVMVLELGANDGLDRVPVATIEQNLSTIIEAARARDIDVLLCGMETPPVAGLDYSLAFHNVFPRVAEKYRLPLVPFLLAGVALIPEMNGPDLVHPNAAGARRIAENVWPYLRPLLAAAR